MKKQKEKKSKKKLYIILAVLAVIAILVSALGSEDSKETETEPPQESEIIQNQGEETEQETSAAPETEPESEPVETPAETESDNPLIAAEISVSDVMNGTKTEKIGEWAEIRVNKDVLKSVTQEQYAEFCEQVVKDSGYNWFTISCEDGTGIQFSGSISYVATYGTLDNEGCITETTGTIMLESDGTYSYTEAE